MFDSLQYGPKHVYNVKLYPKFCLQSFRSLVIEKNYGYFNPNFTHRFDKASSFRF